MFAKKNLLLNGHSLIKNKIITLFSIQCWRIRHKQKTVFFLTVQKNIHLII